MPTTPITAADPTPEADDDPTQEGNNPQVQSARSSLSDAKLFDPGTVPEMPAVQPHAVEAARAKKAAAQAASVNGPAGLKDVDGRPFNPAWHVVDANGSPVINRDGTVRKVGGRGSPKSTGKGPSVDGASQSRINTGPPEPAKADPQVALDAQIAATAKVSADLTFQLGMMLGGPEFKPQPGEAEAMEGAYLGVYVKYGISDLPPLAVLAIVLVTYGGKRWHAPTVVERRQSFKQWAWKWWHRKRLKAEAEFNANRRNMEERDRPGMDILHGAAPAAH